MNDTGQYNREIKEAVQRLAGTFNKDNVHIIQATVNTVDTTKYTCNCTPISGDSTTVLPVVNLSANNNKGFIPIPAKDSTVLVAVSTKNNPPYLIGWDLLQGLICVIQNTDGTISQLIIENGTIQMNDGSYGGLVNIIGLRSEYAKTKAVLDAILSVINGAPVPEAGNGATSGLQTQLVKALIGLQTGDFSGSDIENAKIKHGV